MSLTPTSTLRRAHRHVLDRRARATSVRRAVESRQLAYTYESLHRTSLALAGLWTGTGQPQVNLLLPALSATSVFAGVRTAIEVGGRIARSRGVALRLIALEGVITRPEETRIRAELDRIPELAGLDVAVLDRRDTNREVFDHQDLWLATYWTTAHALDIACRLGVLDRGAVIYLIQDYEPAFSPWSADQALARATYRAGFVPLVNSAPLRDYLAAAESVDLPAEQTFAPSLDLRRLEEAAAGRTRDDTVRVMFYGRPSKPRNMFHLGLSALRRAALRLESEGIPFRAFSVGESHPTEKLTGTSELTSRGFLSWSAYFETLAQVDVVLSLQATPHPSHPPLDAVTSGAYAVTNEVDDRRGRLNQRLLTAEPDPDLLGEAIVVAAREVRAGRVGGFEPGFTAQLGVPLADAVDAALAQLPAAV